MQNLLLDMVDYRGCMSRWFYGRLTLSVVVGWLVLIVMRTFVTAFNLTSLLVFAPVFRVIGFVAMTGLVLAWLAATVRRLHDCGRTGAWVLLAVPWWMADRLHDLSLNRTLHNGALDAVKTYISDLGLIGYVCAGLLSIFLVLPTRESDNRFRQSAGGAWQRIRLVAEDAPPHAPVFDFGPEAAHDRRDVPPDA